MFGLQVHDVSEIMVKAGLQYTSYLTIVFILHQQFLEDDGDFSNTQCQ